MNALFRLWFTVCLALILWRPTASMAEDGPARQAEMAGYLLVRHARAPEEDDGEFCMYVAAGPLLKHYPEPVAFLTPYCRSWPAVVLDP